MPETVQDVPPIGHPLPSLPAHLNLPFHATYDGKRERLPKAFKFSTLLPMRYNINMDIV